MKTTPTHEARIGTIKAAIWENKSSNGVFYTVTFSRLYKDGGGWKSADGFGRDDLLLLAKVADITHTWICGRQRSDAPAEQANSTGEKT